MLPFDINVHLFQVIEFYFSIQFYLVSEYYPVQILNEAVYLHPVYAL